MLTDVTPRHCDYCGQRYRPRYAVVGASAVEWRAGQAEYEIAVMFCCAKVLSYCAISLAAEFVNPVMQVG